MRWRGLRFAGIVLGTAIAVLLQGAGGCGTPLLHPAATADAGERDPGLVGEWLTENDPVVRATIAAPNEDRAASPYSVSITVHDKGQLKSALQLDLILTEIGGVKYADLSLSKAERDKLASTHGLLAIPAHQVVKVMRDGDTLTVAMLRINDATWVSTERIKSVSGNEQWVVTGGTAQIREAIAKHGGDPAAFDSRVVFRRVKAAP